MKITARQTKFRTIKYNDPKFILTDGISICPRAGFEINEHCPREYKMIVTECINQGWLRPVAHVYGKEITIDSLR